MPRTGLEDPCGFSHHARVNTRRQALLLMAPAVAVLLVLFLVPQGFVLEAALSRRDAYGGIVHEWGLHNFARALEPLYLSILARSFGLALATTLGCLLLGYPVAYWLARVCPPRFRNGLLVLVILPFWTSFLVRMYAWMFLLRSEGTLNRALGVVGLGPLELLYRDAAVLLGQVYGELPFMILPLYAALERLDPALLEAAADLGARPSRALWRVTLPLSRAGMVAGSVLVFVPSLGAFLAPDVLGGARTMYVGTLIQSQFAVARDMPFGSAVALLLSGLVLVLLWIFRRPLAQSRVGH
jgi:spermidine/putrescine transport system permease protein